jgi:hypothetical protein
LKSPLERLRTRGDNEQDIVNWIINNQSSSRNLDDLQKDYLIGKRYKEEK